MGKASLLRGRVHVSPAGQRATAAGAERDADSAGVMEAGGVQGFPSVKTFAQLAEAGISSPRFTTLCSWLVAELRTLCQLEEDVTPIRGPEDAETFQIEMHGLLSELHCPYPSLIMGNVTTRLSTQDNCLQLLYFLSSELLAARLQAWKNLRSVKELDKNGEAVRELQHICQALGVPEPGPLSPVGQVMAGIGSQVSAVLSARPPEHQQMAPLLKTPLAPEQWKVLEEIHKVLQAEYQSRKRMMLTRFDVTVASFHWSERAKERSTAMAEAFRSLRWSWPEDCQVTLAHLLAAQEDISCLVKTSSGALRDKTSCAINKVLMTGTVPDRGGRPNEIEPPMPTWEKRREGGGGGRWGKWSKKKR